MDERLTQRGTGDGHLDFGSTCTQQRRPRDNYTNQLFPIKQQENLLDLSKLAVSVEMSRNISLSDRERQWELAAGVDISKQNVGDGIARFIA